MNSRLVRLFLVVGFVAVAAVPASANHGAVVSGGCCDAAPAANCCAPAMRTVTSYVCVPVTFKKMVTTYKRVCKTVPCTGYKCICEPVTKTRTVTHMVRKPITKTICKTVYDRVPVTHTKTVMRSHWVTQRYTVMKTKRVLRFHKYQTCVNAPLKTLCNRIQYHCTKDPCCPGCPPCPATRMVNRCKPCWETVCYPVTCCKRVCVQRPECVTCTSYKCVPRQVQCQVTSYVCEPCTKTETYTCHVTKRVPYTYNRQVWECVPCQQEITCTKYVRKAVCHQVPCQQTSCCQPTCCETSCNTGCCGNRFGGLFGGLRGRFAGGCCNNGCGIETGCGGCGSACGGYAGHIGGHGGGCCH